MLGCGAVTHSVVEPDVAALTCGAVFCGTQGIGTRHGHIVDTCDRHNQLVGGGVAIFVGEGVAERFCEGVTRRQLLDQSQVVVEHVTVGAVGSHREGAESGGWCGPGDGVLTVQAIAQGVVGSDIARVGGGHVFVDSPRIRCRDWLGVGCGDENRSGDRRATCKAVSDAETELALACAWRCVSQQAQCGVDVACRATPRGHRVVDTQGRLQTRGSRHAQRATGCGDAHAQDVGRITVGHSEACDGLRLTRAAQHQALNSRGEWQVECGWRVVGDRENPCTLRPSRQTAGHSGARTQVDDGQCGAIGGVGPHLKQCVAVFNAALQMKAGDTTRDESVEVELVAHLQVGDGVGRGKGRACMTRSKDKGVLAFATAQGVLALSTLEGVVAPATAQGVGLGAALKHVVAGCAGHIQRTGVVAGVQLQGSRLQAIACDFKWADKGTGCRCAQCQAVYPLIAGHLDALNARYLAPFGAEVLRGRQTQDVCASATSK